MLRNLRSVLGSVAVLLAVSPAGLLHAITYGSRDLTAAYGNTGAFIVKAPSGLISPICSGVLIAPTVFLTASHCTSYFQTRLVSAGYTAYVSFDSPIPYGDEPIGSTTLITVSSVVTNPAYNQRQSDTGDIAVLILSGSPADITPAALPTAGLLDGLAAKNGLKRSIFTPAGYGLQNRVVGGGKPYFLDENPVHRMYAHSSFEALNPGFLRLSQNPATGDGGTCYGDSGGPNFLEVNGTPILVAVTITGDAVCRASNVVHRLDIPSARAFLDDYVTLP